MKHICCLGDSLTEGDYGVYGKSGIANVKPENYPYFPAKITGCTVKNFGKCGYTSTSYLRFYRDGHVDLRGADAVIIMLGTNGGLDPLEDTQGNEDFRELLRLCRQDAPSAEIFLCTPPHVTENPVWSNCGYAPQVEKAVAFVRNLAKEMDFPLIETALCPDFTTENEGVMQPNDGLHFGLVGYEVLARFVANAANIPVIA